MLSTPNSRFFQKTFSATFTRTRRRSQVKRKPSALTLKAGHTDRTSPPGMRPGNVNHDQSLTSQFLENRGVDLHFLPLPPMPPAQVLLLPTHTSFSRSAFLLFFSLYTPIFFAPFFGLLSKFRIFLHRFTCRSHTFILFYFSTLAPVFREFQPHFLNLCYFCPY